MRALAFVRARLLLLTKRLLAPLLYRNPPFRLQPARLYVWLDALHETRDISGSVVEIGSDLCGTAVIAHRMLKQLGAPRRYICIDTFTGFVGSQFDQDLVLGVPGGYREMFSVNSVGLVRRVLKQHHAGEIELVQADIAEYQGLPDEIAACLIDVDLSMPTYQALNKVYAKLVPGGVICVDDCPDGYDWKARAGYTRFVREQGLSEDYRFGMGIVRKRPRS